MVWRTEATQPSSGIKTRKRSVSGSVYLIQLNFQILIALSVVFLGWFSSLLDEIESQSYGTYQPAAFVNEQVPEN